MGSVGAILFDSHERSCYSIASADGDGDRGDRKRRDDPGGDPRSRRRPRLVEGLDGLTIGRLAGELGMSKSGLFAHFGSKQELQLATVEAAAARFREAVIDPVADAAEGAPRLRAMATAYLAHLDSDTYSGGCFWARDIGRVRRPARARCATRSRRALEAWLGELERQARIAGVEDPERLAFELYALVMGANSRYRLSRRPAGLRLRPRVRRAAARRAARVSGSGPRPPAAILAGGCADRLRGGR